MMCHLESKPRIEIRDRYVFTRKTDETFEGRALHSAHLLKEQYKPHLPDCRVFHYKLFKDDWPTEFWKQSRQVMQDIRDDPNLWREYAQLLSDSGDWASSCFQSSLVLGESHAIGW